MLCKFKGFLSRSEFPGELFAPSLGDGVDLGLYAHILSILLLSQFFLLGLFPHFAADIGA